MKPWKRIRFLLNREEFDRELQEEMRIHREMAEERLNQTGTSQEEARYGAMKEFGNATLALENSRARWNFVWLESVWRDFRLAARNLRRSPGFTAVAVITLALGIGANTAIFSVVDSVLLRMLPVQHPEQLVQVAMLTPQFGDGHRDYYTNPLWEAIRDNQDVFSGVFAWYTSEFNLAQGGLVQTARGMYVSGDYFRTLGVRQEAGRLFTVNDDLRGCAGTAVLSYGFWRDHFGGAISAIGAMIPIEGHPFQIVGVTPPGFFGTEVGGTFDIAVPICSAALINGKHFSLDNRSFWLFQVMARSKPGLNREQVSAHLASLSPQVFAATVPTNWNPTQQRSYHSWTILVEPAATGISLFRRYYALPLKMLMGIAGLVLLIACANIASLMLARMAFRRKEISVRLALGASRGRLIRQLLTESLVLSVAGAAIGILLARWTSQLLVRYVSTENNHIYLNLSLDSRVLAFTAGAAILTGLLFGVLPAFRSTRVSLADSIKGGDQAGGDTRFRAGRWSVALQVACSFVLVITAVLFVRSFAKLASLDAGFDRNNVLVANVSFRHVALPNTAQRKEIVNQIASLPGVTNVSESVLTPVSNRDWYDMIVVDGAHAPTGDDSDVDLNCVAPGYFATMRTRFLEGRDFTDRDTGPVPTLVIINQALAQKFYPGVDPVGKTMRRYATATTLGAPIEVIGVVANTKYDSLREDFPPIAYFPFGAFTEEVSGLAVVIRTGVAPSALTPAVEQAVGNVNKSLSLDFTTLAEQVDDSMVRERLLATLSGFFGTLALLLAAIGLYGVMAYLVLQRQKEIGIRMALGARRGAIVGLIMRDVAVILLAGIVAGLGISWVATRLVQGLLFGLQAHNAATIVMGLALLVGVAALATYLPARRATEVDPIVALRHE